MTALYLANPTRQNRIVHLRVPERPSPIVQTIPPGRQIKVAGVDSTAQVEAILRSTAKYGWREASEVRADTKFVGIIYGLDRPIKHPKIAAVMNHNKEVLNRQGQRTRKLAAVATNKVIDDAIAESNVDAVLQKTEVEMIELDEPSTAHEGDRLAEGVEINRSAETGPAGEVKGGGRRRNRE